ncbi:MAG: phospholipid/cholesterol/gamma-HCH transport system substrate-binding protein [Thermoleophilaceae bacterium]|jgi:virulence factor Mce-like protein|nr:phospholipid/cholesterol/gamma-HCH transport system substrate-binding protein [Thermoleophilaceae bacterium]
MAVIVALLLFATLAILIVTAQPPPAGDQVVAEFRNAFPLIQGMHVRVGGAIAGSVGKIEVNEEGLAAVTLNIDDSIEAPKADATAAIREQDTTGDSYVSYEPGTAQAALPEQNGIPTISCDARQPTAPCANTLAAPRFDDLLNAFGPRERTGVRLLLVELAHALDQRGEDVNRAAIELRPALDAADQALTEINRQNGALRSVIGDAEAVTSQAADHRAELDRLISSLNTTLGVTASESDHLDAALADLPATLGKTRSTLAALADAATAGRPLAQQLLAASPRLATALRKAPGFLDDTEFFLDDTEPTLDLTRKLLRAGAPTIAANPDRVVTGPFDLGPALSNLLTGVLGDSHTFGALFGDDSNGKGKGTLERSGLGAVSVEPANVPGYPAGFADRRMTRITGVLNCESFGLPVKPGCLAGALTAARRAEAKTASGAVESGSGKGKGGSKDKADRAAKAAGRHTGDVASGKAPGLNVLDTNLGDLLGGAGQRIKDTVGGVGKKVKDGLDRLGGGREGGGASGGSEKPLKPLLDLLLR